MIPLEMRLGREIAKELEDNGVVVFTDSRNQDYALFKIKDIEVSPFKLSTDSIMYIVTIAKHKEDK